MREAGRNRFNMGLDKHGNEEQQYLIKPQHIDINEIELEKESGIKKPSNLFAWRIAANGDIHALKSHDDVPDHVPDWKDKTVEAIKRGKPEKNKNPENKNVVIYKIEINDKHYLHVAVLIGKEINYVKSISYRTYRKKDKKIK